MKVCSYWSNESGGTSLTGNASQISYNQPAILDGTAYAFTICGDADADGSFDTTCGGNDCDESNPAVGGNTAEICADGIDQDCTGYDLLTDLDGDGDVEFIGISTAQHYAIILFKEITSKIAFTVAQPFDIVVGDANLDGRPDAFVSSVGNIVWFRQAQGGSLDDGNDLNFGTQHTIETSCILMKLHLELTKKLK